MSKSVLISIQPKWCELIASGKKTVEVRKTAPEETPFKVYIYCTSVKNMNLSEYVSIHAKTGGAIDYWSGKIIGEFICDKVEDIYPEYGYLDACCEGGNYYILDKCCLSRKELIDYGKSSKKSYPMLYGWHISELKIYDEPRELYNFHRVCNKKCSPSCDWYIEHDYTECGCGGKPNITRPPQSWCYVEEV